MAVLRKYGLLDAVWLRLYCGLTRRNVFGRSHVRSESPPFPPSSRALVSFALVLLLHKSSVYNGHHVNTVHAVLPADSRPGSKRGVQHREKPVARRTVSPRRWER